MNDVVFYAITIIVLFYLAYSVAIYNINTHDLHHPIVPEPWDISMTEEE